MATLTTLGFSIISTYNGAGVTRARIDIRALNNDLDNSSKKSRESSSALGAIAAAAVTVAPAMVPIGAAALAAGASVASLASTAGSALGAYGIVMDKTITSTLKLAKAHKALTPVQQEFVTSVNQMKAAMDGVSTNTMNLTLKTATIFVQGLTTGIQRMTPIIRAVDPIVRSVAQAFKNWTAGSGMTKFIDTIQKYGIPALKNLVAAGRSVMTVLGDAFRALAPLGLKLSEVIKQGAANLAKWANGGGFQRFLDYVHSNGPLIKQILSNLGQILAHVGQSMKDLAPISLRVTEILTGLIAKLPPSALNAIAVAFVAIKTAMAGMAIITGIVSGIESFAAAMKAVRDATLLTRIELAALKVQQYAVAAASGIATAAQWLWNAAMDANPIAIIVIAIAALVAGIVYLATQTRFFQTVWAGMVVAWHATVNGMVTAWHAVSAALVAAWNATWNGLKLAGQVIWNAITAAWRATVSGLATAFTVTAAALRVAWNAVWNGLKLAGQVVWNAITAAWRVTVSGLATAFNATAGGLKVAWSATWNGLKLAGQVIWNAITAAWRATVSGLATAFNATAGALKAAWSAAWNGMKTAAQAIWNAMQTAWHATVTALSNFATESINFIKNAWQAGWNGVKTAVTAIWNALSAAWHATVTAISNFTTESIGFIKNAWNAGWNAVKSAAEAVWNALKSAWHAAVTALSNYTTESMGFIKNAWNTAWNAIKSIGSTIWNALKAAWHAAVTALSNYTTESMNFIKSHWSAAWNAIKSAAQAVWNALKAAWHAAVTALSNYTTESLNFIKSHWTSAWNAIKSVASTVWNAIKSGFSAFAKAVENTLSSLVSKAKSIWDKIVNIFKTPVNAVIGIWDTVAGAVGLPKIQKLATGGQVSGPGTATSDSIPAMLSHGEYVINAKAVKTYGVGTMNALNAQRLATGGPVNGGPGTRGTTHEPVGITMAGGQVSPIVVQYFADGGGSDNGDGKKKKKKDDGGILGDIGGAISGAVGAIGDALKDVGGIVADAAKGIFTKLKDIAATVAYDVLKPVLDKILSGIPHPVPGIATPAGNVPYATAKKIIDSGLDKIKAAEDQAKAAAFSQAVGAIPAGDHLKVIQEAMAAAGVPPPGTAAQWLAGMNTLITRESAWNPNAINRTDSNAAAGHPSQGLAQTIPSTFSAYHVAGTSNNILDPVANVAAAIRYIVATYGNITNVQQAFGATPHGYANGTPGANAGWHLVGERGIEMRYFRGGERVRNNRDTLAAIRGSGGAGTVTLEMPITVQGNLDSEAVDKLESQTIPKLRTLLQQGTGKRIG